MNVEDTRQDAVNRVGDPRRQFANYPAYVLRSMNRVYRKINTDLMCLQKRLLLDSNVRSDHTGVINGSQEDVNELTLDTGHDVVVGDEVYNRAWMGKRTVTASAATTITINGLPVSIVDEDEIKTLSLVWTKPGDMVSIERFYPNQIFQDPARWGAISGCYTIQGNDIILGGSTASTDGVIELWYFSSGSELVDADTADLTAGQANSPEWAVTGVHDLLMYATCLEISGDYKLRRQDQDNYKQLYALLSDTVTHLQEQTPMVTGGWGPSSAAIDVYEKPGYQNQG